MSKHRVSNYSNTHPTSQIVFLAAGITQYSTIQGCDEGYVDGLLQPLIDKSKSRQCYLLDEMMIRYQHHKQIFIYLFDTKKNRTVPGPGPGRRFRRRTTGISPRVTIGG